MNYRVFFVLFYSILLVSCISKIENKRDKQIPFYKLEIKPFNRNNAIKNTIKTQFFVREEEFPPSKSYKLTSFSIEKKDLIHLSHIIYNKSDSNINVKWQFNKKYLKHLKKGKAEFSFNLKPKTRHSWKIIYKK